MCNNAASRLEWLAIRSVIDGFLAKASPGGLRGGSSIFAVPAAEDGVSCFSYDPYAAVARHSPDTPTDAWEPQIAWVVQLLSRLSGRSSKWDRKRRAFSLTPGTLGEAQLLAQGAATSEWLAIRSIIDDFVARASAVGSNSFDALAAVGGGSRFSYDPYAAVSRLSPDTPTDAWEPRISWVLGRLSELSSCSVAWDRTQRAFSLTPPRVLSAALPPAHGKVQLHGGEAAPKTASEKEEQLKYLRAAMRNKKAREAEAQETASRNEEQLKCHSAALRSRTIRKQIELQRLIRESFVAISADW